MKNNNLKKKIFIICFGFTIICVCLTLLSNTLIQQRVLMKGSLKTVKVEKTTSKRTIKSIYIKIDDKLYFAGEAFGEYHNTIKGDSIRVYFLEGEKYVVLNGKLSYKNSKVAEYFFIIVGICLILIGFFYKDKEKSFLQPESITVNRSLNKNDIREIIDLTLPNNADLNKLDKNQIRTIKGNIIELYKSNSQTLMYVIYMLLLEKNEKAETIYDAILEFKCLTEKLFIDEFKKAIKFYNGGKNTFYLRIIQIFLISEQSENLRIREQLIVLIENNTGFNLKIKNELLRLL